jgi:hypothetical protein
MKQKVRRAIAATPEERKQAKLEKKHKLQAHIRESGIPRDNRGRWLKGVSGNDLGRPRTALAELCREQVTKHGLVQVLGSIAARTGEYNKKSKISITVSDQINAIRLLLLYGYGLPKNEIDTGEVKIEVSYSDNRSINIAHAAQGAGDDHPAEQALQQLGLRAPLGKNDAGSGSLDSSGTAG